VPLNACGREIQQQKMSKPIFPQEKSNPVSIRTAAHEHFLPFPGQTLRVSPIKKQATTDYQGLDEKQPRKSVTNSTVFLASR